MTVSVVKTCTWYCKFVLSYYHTYILTQHIRFLFTAVQFHIHVQWSSLCQMHMCHITFTFKHDMPRFLYPCFTKYRSSHVMCVVNFKCVILSHTHLIQSMYFEYTRYDSRKSVEFKNSWLLWNTDKEGCYATVTSTCQSSHSMKFSVIQQRKCYHSFSVDEHTTPRNKDARP